MVSPRAAQDEDLLGAVLNDGLTCSEPRRRGYGRACL